MDDRRPPRGEDRLLAVIDRRAGAAATILEDILHRRRVDLDLRIADGRLHTEPLEKPGIGAEQLVGPDGIGLAAGPQAEDLADDRVDPVERQLEGEHADHLPAVEDRRCDEPGGLFVGGEIGAESAEVDNIPAPGGGRLAEHLPEARLGESAVLERRGEVDLLEDRVDDLAAFGIDEEDVVETVGP